MGHTAPLAVVARALEQLPGASDWQAQQTTQYSTQVFLVGERLETRRAVFGDQVQVQVFHDHPPHATPASKDAPGGLLPAKAADAASEERAPDTKKPPSSLVNPLMRGTTKRSLLTDEIANPARLRQALEEAVLMAGLTDNLPYRLPTPPPGGFPLVEMADPALVGSDAQRQAALEGLHERLLAAVAAEPGIRLSSAELFATATEIGFRTSQGIQAARVETEVSCDLVLLAGDGAQVAEYHAAPQHRRIADLDISALVRRAGRAARDSLRCQLTPTHQGPVVLSGEALGNLLSPLIFHSSARAAYQSLSRFTPGASICGEQAIQGDPLTLLSNALWPYGLASAPFSAEGIPGQRVTLIQDGVFQTRWAEQRYADYLAISPTGPFANAEIPAGAHPLSDLLETDGPVFHLVAFAWLNPDELTGDFVAEIKLGYRIEHGQTTPIKGGSLSGNLFDALAQARFSRETQFTGSYVGPQAIRFERLTISGN